MQYFTYIIQSDEADRYYIGITSNPEERVKKHNTNHKGFTGSKNDWKLVYIEEFTSKLQALKRERQIKNWKNKQRIEELISRNTK